MYSIAYFVLTHYYLTVLGQSAGNMRMFKEMKR
jgi:hypothetical protein